MSSCCSPDGFGRTFNEKFARRMAARYRKRGLDKTATRMVDLLASADVAGAEVLEIGGGVGEIHVELLKRGAARATNLELSTGYDAAARLLLDQTGLADRVERRILDIAADPDAVAPADIVVLHRVVCCYPDYERLLTAAAKHARRTLVLSYPPRNPVSVALVSAQNGFLRLRGSQFRFYPHPPERMLGVLSAHGMRVEAPRAATVWRVASATR